MENTHKKIADQAAELYAVFAPLLCGILDLADDDEKFAFIGATTEMLLGLLVSHWLYGDFTAPTTDETERTKFKIAAIMGQGCLKRLSEVDE